MKRKNVNRPNSFVYSTSIHETWIKFGAAASVVTNVVSRAKFHADRSRYVGCAVQMSYASARYRTRPSTLPRSHFRAQSAITIENAMVHEKYQEIFNGYRMTHAAYY